MATRGEIPDRLGRPTPFATPRALQMAEIAEIVEDVAANAARAMAAGLDGVEIHAANSFLIDQFLRDSTNRRTNAYGGPVAHRSRFLLEVVDAVAARIGAGRVGVRIWPINAVFGISDSDPEVLFTHVARRLSDRKLAYLHVLEPANGSDSAMATTIPNVARKLRAGYGGLLVLNGGLTRATGAAALVEGRADAIAFGTPFIANPDLVARFRSDLPLAAPDPATY